MLIILSSWKNAPDEVLEIAVAVQPNRERRTAHSLRIRTSHQPQSFLECLVAPIVAQLMGWMASVCGSGDFGVIRDGEYLSLFLVSPDLSLINNLMRSCFVSSRI